MRNIRIRLAYDGTNYCGWQMQSNGMSIQAIVEKAILDFTGTSSSVIAAGRTDAGVHAIGQVAHFHTQSQIPLSKFRAGLQSYLPRDIVVLAADEVSPHFHARYQAIRKRYRYVIDNSLRPCRSSTNMPTGNEESWMSRQCTRQDKCWWANMTF